jgi:hypothetical protein
VHPSADDLGLVLDMPTMPKGFTAAKLAGRSLRCTTSMCSALMLCKCRRNRLHWLIDHMLYSLLYLQTAAETFVLRSNVNMLSSDPYAVSLRPSPLIAKTDAVRYT